MWFDQCTWKSIKRSEGSLTTENSCTFTGAMQRWPSLCPYCHCHALYHENACMLLAEIKMSLIWSCQLNLECEKLYGINDSIFFHEKTAFKKKWKRGSTQCQRFKRHFNQMHGVHFGYKVTVKWPIIKRHFGDRGMWLWTMCYDVTELLIAWYGMTVGFLC